MNTKVRPSTAQVKPVKPQSTTKEEEKSVQEKPKVKKNEVFNRLASSQS